MRERTGTLILLLSGPVLAAAYAAVNYAALRTASGARGPDPADPMTSGGLTSLGSDLWWIVRGIALVAGVAAAGIAVVGLLLRRAARGRGALLVLSGVLILPYTLGLAAAVYNPVPRLAGFYDHQTFADALPPYQWFSALLLLAAALAQAVGMVRAYTAARTASTLPR
ncbi:hypothetical protein ACIBQ6_17930 [Nonomuraea sp. NPDC049655]|uniref:hypothetical protein n=1 Tax=Nonomuraea sp. NPDC049655 TaxID=3364355 RepID=UPI0037A9405C